MFGQPQPEPHGKLMLRGQFVRDLGEKSGRVSVDAAISPAMVRKELSGILENDLFAESDRMSRFLRFAVEETLSGNAAQLKENVIGVQVFDREPGYDPRIDPIVRVEARRLRSKLTAFYQREGSLYSLIIEIPKGRYSPVFRLRDAGPPPKREMNAVAVLPFSNLSLASPSELLGCEFLSDGLAEELINALTRVPGLRVVAWNSAVQLRGQDDQLQTIRERLGVAYVLRGSIREIAGRLRISAHLIETSTNHYVWSEIYDREFRDLLAIQAVIASAIVGALRLKFSPDPQSTEAPGAIPNLECYQLCLRGRFHARERTADGLQRSVFCFEQAIAEDDTSASAYAGLADAYTLMAEHGFAEGAASLKKAKAAVQEALHRNESSAEAYASYGLIVSLHDWDWEESERAYLRSLELNPGYAAAHHWYGINYLAPLARFDEASHHLDIAVQLDPLSAVMLEGCAFHRTLSRQYDEAILFFSKIFKLDPSFYKSYTGIGRAYLQMGSYGKAIEYLEKGISIVGEVPHILGALGQAYGLAGKHQRAREILAKLQRLSSQRPVLSATLAILHIGLNDKEGALTYLEHAVERRETAVTYLLVHPAYDDLRKESRFQALLDTIGFHSPASLP